MNPVAGFKAFLENISLLMIENGWEVTVLYLSKQDKISINGTKEIVYDLNEHIDRNCRDINLFLKQLVRRLSFRLTHGSQSASKVLKNNLFHSQVKAINNAKACTPKLDLNQYDYVISAEEIQCNYFLAYSVYAKKKIGYIHPDYNRTPYDRELDQKVLSKLDYICATSSANAESIKRALPVIKEKVIGVPNPINVTEIVHRSTEIDNIIFDTSILNIITVCRLDNTYKALDRLLVIANRLVQSGDRFVWRIIGDGEFKEEMQMYIAEHNLYSYVIIMGELPNPIPYVKESDLFVLQSYSEGYPMSVCEALAVDTPVLVTHYPSATEQVIDGFTGFIVENNTDDIFNKLHRIINAPNVVKQIHTNLQAFDKSKLSNMDNLMKLMR